MRDLLSSAWWVLLIRGVLAIAFGLAALIWPAQVLMLAVFFFGVYALVSGAVALYGAIKGAPGQSRGWLIFSGVLGVLAGIAVMVWPAMTAVVLFIWIAAWLVVTGICEIIAAIMIRKQVQTVGALVVGGALSTVVGILLFIWPKSGALALIWLAGTASIIFGVVLVFLAFRLKKMIAVFVPPPPGGFSSGASDFPPGPTYS